MEVENEIETAEGVLEVVCCGFKKRRRGTVADMVVCTEEENGGCYGVEVVVSEAVTEFETAEQTGCAVAFDVQT